MKNSKSEYDYLNREWEKKHAPVKQEWNYLESQTQAWRDRERRIERRLTIIVWTVIIAGAIAGYLLKHYKILGG